MDVSILQRHLARTPPFVQQLVLNGIVAFTASPAGQIIGLLLQLSNRLQGPHPLASPESLTNDELDKVSYEDINMLKAIPREPTHIGYAVIGGSGFVGTYVCIPNAPIHLAERILTTYSTGISYGSSS